MPVALKVLWPTMKNPPSPISLWLVSVNLPPGPIGPGCMVPEAVHVPSKYFRRASSGAGLGGAGGFCACISAAASRINSNAHTLRLIIIGSFRLKRDFSAVMIKQPGQTAKCHCAQRPLRLCLFVAWRTVVAVLVEEFAAVPVAWFEAHAKLE